MSQEIKSKRQEGRERWLGLMAEWKSSDEPQAEFCKRREINIHTFNYWRNKLNGENKSKNKSTFSQARVSSVNTQANNLRLIIPNGVQVLIPPGFDKSGLKDFFELMGILSC